MKRGFRYEVGYEEEVREMKKSYRKVSGRAVSGDYKVEMVTSGREGVKR